MINFKGAQFPKDVILFAVWFYVRFSVSYRDLEEIMEERGRVAQIIIRSERAQPETDFRRCVQNLGGQARSFD